MSNALSLTPAPDRGKAEEKEKYYGLASPLIALAPEGRGFDMGGLDASGIFGDSGPCPTQVERTELESTSELFA